MALPQPNSETPDRESLSHGDAATITTEHQAILSTLTQYLHDVVTAQPHLLPTIREFVESKDIANELAKPSTSPRKRKRGGTEDSTYLGTLFDFLAPAPSGRVILRPRKVVKDSNNAVACETRARGPSFGNGSDIETAKFSGTESLEKRMERCFGVVPDKSVASLARPQKRQRLSDDGDGDTEKNGNDGLAMESIKKPKKKKTGRLELVHKTLTLEWDLDASNVELGDICPFSLYPTSSCAWGSYCRLKSVCAGKPCKELPCTKEHLRWTCGFLVRRERCPMGSGCVYGHDRVEQRLASYARRFEHLQTGR